MIKRSTYKNKACYMLTGPGLSASVIPEPGGKVASLKDLGSGFEHMVQREGEVYRDQPYDGVYVNAECSGFDDMFPTIDTCHYESPPWKGTVLPDHGEVWSLPWEHEVRGETLHLRVRGVRLPYLLEKRVSILAEKTLRLDYTLTNESAFDMDFLWAAHVMAAAEAGARIVVPRCCRTAMTAFSTSGRMGRYGDSVPWPAFTGPDGRHHRADIVRPPTAADNEKYYFRDPLDEGWCAVSSASGGVLALSFPVTTVPYLGVLLNEQGFDNRTNVFLEPCTATFDRVDVARLRRQCSSVKAGSRYEWHLCMTVGNLADGEELVGVAEDGSLVTEQGGAGQGAGSEGRG
jgi:hypothetical protein